MKVFLFLGFLGATGLLFWSARKKFQVSGELTWHGFFTGLANRGTDLVFLVSAFVVAVFLFQFFSPLIEGLDSDSIIKSLLVLFFSGAIIAPVILILKKVIGKKEMIFVYGFSFLIFAFIVRAKVPGIFNMPECQFDLGIRVYIGLLFAIWVCSYWESKLQEKFALPFGFLLLATQFLWSGYLKTGSPWQEYLKEPEIITFIAALFGLLFIFYKKIEWRKRIGYWMFIFPAFIILFLQGLTIVLLLQFGGLSLEELAYRREVPQLVNLSVSDWRINKELGDLRIEIAELKKKKKEGIIKPSEKIDLNFTSRRALRLGVKKLELAKKEVSELKKELAQDDSLFWAQKRVWQDIVLPNYSNLKGGN